MKVTGGGNGLGRGICVKLSELGCKVAIVDIDKKAAETTAYQLLANGCKTKAYFTDVTKSEEIIKLREEITSDLGPVDILVCSILIGLY